MALRTWGFMSIAKVAIEELTANDDDVQKLLTFPWELALKS